MIVMALSKRRPLIKCEVPGCVYSYTGERCPISHPPNSISPYKRRGFVRYTRPIGENGVIYNHFERSLNGRQVRTLNGDKVIVSPKGWGMIELSLQDQNYMSVSRFRHRAQLWFAADGPYRWRHEMKTSEATSPMTNHTDKKCDCARCRPPSNRPPMERHLLDLGATPDAIVRSLGAIRLQGGSRTRLTGIPGSTADNPVAAYLLLKDRTRIGATVSAERVAWWGEENRARDSIDTIIRNNWCELRGRKEFTALSEFIEKYNAGHYPEFLADAPDAKQQQTSSSMRPYDDVVKTQDQFDGYQIDRWSDEGGPTFGE
jgi:hypothetical protein